MSIFERSQVSPAATPGASAEGIAAAPPLATASSLVGSDRGIDVSHHQGIIDWSKVAGAGASFAFAKATEGVSFVDPKFASNWEAMKDAGLVRGAYHFFLPSLDAAAQANHFLATVQYEPGDLPPVLDLETDPTTKTLAEDVKTWLTIVAQATGCNPIIYVSRLFWNTFIDGDFSAYPLWVVDIEDTEPTLPRGWTAWTFWQYTFKGTVDGVDRPVDLDHCVDLSAVARIPTPSRPPPALDETATNTSPIPPRPAGAISGTQFATQIAGLSQPLRDQRVFEEISRGNLPDFLRSFVPVTVTATLGGVEHTLVYQVMPDYLAVGSDADYLRMPMSPLTAQAIGDAFQCLLPTRKMVCQISAAAAVKLAPHPFDPKTHPNETVPVFVLSNQAIQAELAQAGAPLGALVDGIKKDVVISALIAENPDHVVIFGWFQTNGDPIQPLFAGHLESYMDYSHGLRMVQATVLVDGKPMSLVALLADPVLSALVSDERPILQPRYLGAGPMPSSPKSSISASSSGSIVTFPAGTLGLDRSATIGPHASGLAAHGYAFALRTVDFPDEVSGGALTASEVTQILSAGLALGLNTPVRSRGFSESQGTRDGEAMVQAASALGVPARQGMVLWYDLETDSRVTKSGGFCGPDGEPVSVSTMATYLQNWAGVVADAGYVPGLYNGPQSLLSRDEVLALEGYAAFWNAGDNEAHGGEAYQLQQGSDANKVVAGINVDEDTVQIDAHGKLPTFWRG